MNDIATRVRRLAEGVRLAGRLVIPRQRAEEVEALLADAARMIGAEASSYMLLDEATGELYFVAASGPVSEQVKRLRLKRGEGLAASVLATGHTLAVQDASHDPRWKRDAGTGFVAREVLVVPVMTSSSLEGEVVVGVVEFLNKAGGFSPEDMVFAGHLARVIGRCYEGERFLHDGGRLMVAMLDELLSDAGLGEDKALVGHLKDLASGAGADAEAWALADTIAAAATTKPEVLKFARAVLEGALSLGRAGGDHRAPGGGGGGGGTQFDNAID